jgi:hypothetical protein
MAMTLLLWARFIMLLALALVVACHLWVDKVDDA